MRTIRVTGRGSISIHPDITVLTLKLSGSDPEYDTALNKAAGDSQRIKSALLPLGFEAADIKTSCFEFGADFDVEYEEKRHKRKFLGFKYRHDLRLEFNSDNERLGRIFEALRESGADPEIDVSYTLADKEAAKNALLKAAAADSAAKAEVLAGAAGVRLGQIQNIDYSWEESDFGVRPLSRAVFADYDYGAFEIEPCDIRLNETVTIVWEIL